MFIARSTRRIRFARTAFVLAGVLPCAVLVAWAVHRHSAVHREAIRRQWEQALGLPVAIASVEHPLPGAVRARGCSLAAADGRPVLAAAAVEVETSSTEVRLRIGELDCDPAGAAALAGLAGEWLWRGARFRRDVVIDVADFAWQVPGAEDRLANSGNNLPPQDAATADPGNPRRCLRSAEWTKAMEGFGHGQSKRHPLGPVRIECVTQDGARAVRMTRRHADDGADEVRIVRSGGDAAGAGRDRVDVEALCAEPVPFPVVATVAADGPVAALSLGGSAAVRGRLTATCVDGRWAGTASGRIELVDLASCTAALPAGAIGTMDMLVHRIEWRDGRLAACEFTCDVGAGRADRRLLEALVDTVGCRAGAAYVGSAVERERAFDAAGCEVRIDGRGIELAGSSRLDGALAVAAGRPLLEPPAGIVRQERLARLLAPTGAVYVPSSGPGSWLMSVLPQGGAPVERTSQGGHAADGGGF